MPAGIGIVNRKSASDVITIKTKIIAPDSAKTMVIPKTIFDTGSDSSLISSNIVKRLELDVDKTNAPDLSGVATKSDTMGTTYGQCWHRTCPTDFQCPWDVPCSMSRPIMSHYFKNLL